MRLFTLAVAAVALTGLVRAQGAQIGVKAGWAATEIAEGVTGFGEFDAHPYIIGPAFEFGGAVFRMEVDALYRPVEFTAEGVERSSSVWEFPVMAKIRIPIPFLKPFVVAGPSFRTLPSDFDTDTEDHIGITGGAGIDFRFVWFTLTPEARYTYWTGTPSFAGPVQTFLTFPRNQVAVLLGFSFGK